MKLIFYILYALLIKKFQGAFIDYQTVFPEDVLFEQNSTKQSQIFSKLNITMNLINANQTEENFGGFGRFTLNEQYLHYNLFLKVAGLSIVFGFSIPILTLFGIVCKIISKNKIEFGKLKSATFELNSQSQKLFELQNQQMQQLEILQQQTKLDILKQKQIDLLKEEQSYLIGLLNQNEANTIKIEENNAIIQQQVHVQKEIQNQLIQQQELFSRVDKVVNEVFLNQLKSVENTKALLPKYNLRSKKSTN